MSGGRQALACRPPFYSWGSFGLFAQKAEQEGHELGAGAVASGAEGGGADAADDAAECRKVLRHKGFGISLF